MKRSITNKETVTFYSDDRDIVGYLIGGELTTVEPTDEEKERFEGDWSTVCLADVWSMIHNGDRQPVTFWVSNKEWVTYYPHHMVNTQFRVITARFHD